MINDLTEGLKIVQNLIKSYMNHFDFIDDSRDCFILFIYSFRSVLFGVHPVRATKIYINGFVQTSSKSLDINT